MSSYCVKCKRATLSAGKAALVKTKNNRVMAKSKCKTCGTVKCQFVSAAGLKGQKGDGFLGDLVNFVAPIAGSVAGAAYGNPALGMSLGNIAGGLGKKIPF